MLDKKLKKSEVLGVHCEDGEATVVGTALVDGQEVSFVVRVEDHAKKGKNNDVFTVRWTGGDTYAAGGPLTAGNVKLKQP